MDEQWVSIEQISKLSAELGRGASAKGLLSVAAREKWESRKRAGRGGGREFNVTSLPSELRSAFIRVLHRAENRADSSTVEQRDFAFRGCAFESRSARLNQNQNLLTAAVPGSSSTTPRDSRAE